MLKKSFYTIIEELDNSLLMYNSYSGALLNFTDNAKEKAKSLLLNKVIVPNDDNRELINLLTSKNMLVSCELDEKSLVDQLEEKAFDNKGMLMLVIMPTEQCNFRCRYCYENFSRGKMSKVIQTQIVEFVENNIQKYTALNVQWLGGEPLMAQDVIDNLSYQLIDICKRNHKLYFASMITNGYYLTSEVAKRMYKNRILSYQITLDGLKEVHDSQRIMLSGNRTFDEIVKNLIDIRDNYGNGKIDILLRTNITTSSIETLNEYIEFLVSTFGGYSKFNIEWDFAKDMGGDRIDGFKDNLLDSKTSMKMLFDYKRNAINKGLKFASDRYMLNPGSMVCYSCYKNSYIIGSDGSVYKCCDDMYSTESKIGVLNNNGELKIDEDKKACFCSLSSTREIAKCKECKIRPICLGLKCPLYRIRNSGKVECLDMKTNLVDYMKHLSLVSNRCKVISKI